MKKRNKLSKKLSTFFWKGITIMALGVCLIAREGICFFIYHENDFPDEMRDL